MEQIADCSTVNPYDVKSMNFVWLYMVIAEAGESFGISTGAPCDTDEMEAAGGPGRGNL